MAVKREEYFRQYNQGKCVVDGCMNFAKTRHLCPKHLSRFYRNGNAVVTVNRPKGTGSINVWGYKEICINGKRMKEHRYIMEQFLHRKLEPNEDVHHVNGNKLDNRIENLIVLITNDHHYTHRPIANPIENGKKKCIKCFRILPIERFSRTTSRTGKQGYRPDCKSCQNNYNKNRIKHLSVP